MTTMAKKNVEASMKKLTEKMGVLVDLSRCTGCRGCQVACKQWNKNRPEKTCFEGTYENPPDLSADTFTRVQFREIEEEGGVQWHFRKIQCRHCLEPGCVEGDPGSFKRYEKSGIVLADRSKKAAAFNDARDNCPFDVPRQRDGVPFKCTFCWDRREMGLEPACVTACPTGTLKFGKYKELLAEAKELVKKLKPRYPKVAIDDTVETMWIYVVPNPGAFE